MRSREWLPGAFALLLVGCAGEDSEGSGSDLGNIGAPCILTAEEQTTFSGFAFQEFSYEVGSVGCDSGYCISYHFQGRASCPYGQTQEQATTDPRCFVPDSDEPISVPVDPQLVARGAEEVVTCSCPCAGMGDGPSCTCPRGTVCQSILSGLGGSFCVSPDTVYDPTHPPSPEVCDSSAMNCGDPRPY